MPTLGPDASPEVVVATYLAAAQSGDTRAGRTLMTEEHARQGGLLGEGATFTDVVISPAESRPTVETDETGRSSAGGHDEAVSVRVDAEVEGLGESVPDGSLAWFVLLVRDDGGPWLIRDEGTGP